MGGKSEVEETAEQKAQSEFATKQLADYKQRWLPVQQHLASQIQDMGGADSAARKNAEGRAVTDTGMKFAGAQDTLQKTAANTVGLGSSRAKLAITGLGTDQAQSKGLGLTAADQQIDDAYTQALGALTATGQGERAQVANSMSQQANASAHQATADAEAALTQRMGTARVVGQVAGAGLQAGMGSFGKAAGGISGTNDIAGVNGGNAFDQWAKFGVGGD